MRTTLLVTVLVLTGSVMIGAGLWGLSILFGYTGRIPLRNYAVVIGLLSGGVAMGALAQALRLLLAIYRQQLLDTHQYLKR